MSSDKPRLSSPLRIGVVGMGRMGTIHAHHVLELARETGRCELAAISTTIPEEAERFIAQTGTTTPVFGTIEALAAANICNAAVVATNTALHWQHTALMLNAGKRVFLEKPLTGSLQGDRDFVRYLEREHPDDVMLGFQRRFDAPLCYAKQLLEDGAIGRLFRIYSALEDSGPAPDGFESPGLLPDMCIHNVDEACWFSGRTPKAAMAVGSRIYSHRLTTSIEDFDDALLLMDFGGDPGHELIGEVQVGRNHVAGYRSETVLYGENGQICVGRFRGNPRQVLVECYGRRDSGQPVQVHSFATRTYAETLPEFAERFGEAYKGELRAFVDCCLDGSRFPVTHRDALLAQEVIEAGMRTAVGKKNMAKIRYISCTPHGFQRH